MTQYDGPIIDTHHHIWLHKNVAWLHPPVTPKLFGDYFGLRRDFPIDEWMNDIVPEKVVKSVHVTANWGVDKSLDETKWLQSIADKHGYPHGFTVQADLTDPNLDATLKGHKAFPNVRGVRHQLYWESHPLHQVVSQPDLCNTPEFRRGFALLEKYGLHFELQVFASQAKYAAELIKAFPKPISSCFIPACSPIASLCSLNNGAKGSPLLRASRTPMSRFRAWACTPTAGPTRRCAR